MKKHSKFELHKNKTEYHNVDMNKLRDKSIFYHKNITKEDAIRLFNNAIDTSKCNRIICPNGAYFVLNFDNEVVVNNLDMFV